MRWPPARLHCGCFLRCYVCALAWLVRVVGIDRFAMEVYQQTMEGVLESINREAIIVMEHATFTLMDRANKFKREYLRALTVQIEANFAEKMSKVDQGDKFQMRMLNVERGAAHRAVNDLLSGNVVRNRNRIKQDADLQWNMTEQGGSQMAYDGLTIVVPEQRGMCCLMGGSSY